MSLKGEGGTTELLYGRGEGIRAARSQRGRMVLLLAVTLLCGVAYLAGVWYGMQGRMTCVVTGAGQMQCSTGDLPPAQPAQPESGTA